MNKTSRRFNVLMEFAREVEKCDPRGLTGVIRILGTAILSEFLMWRMESMSERPPLWPHPDWLLFPASTKIGANAKTFGDLCPEVSKRKKLDLARTLVLPSPWNRTRLVKSMASIGPGRIWGPWKYDSRNHRIEYWEPIGIAWGLNGNHSLAVGVIAGKGMLTVDTVRDITPLYGMVTCDGIHYRNNSHNAVGPVNSAEFAAIFEIGRLLVKHGISA